MKKLIVLLLVVLSANVVLAEDPVYFADENLEAVVEATLGIIDPTPTDMLGLTFLDANLCEIVELTGTETATNLTRLLLCGNQISDISPLSGLTNLTELNLGSNQISDISALSSLTNLTSLYLYNNQISDISPISGLTNLTSLFLHDNQISDISPLSGLTNLLVLFLLGNPLDCPAYDIYIPIIKENNPSIFLRCDPRPEYCDYQPYIVSIDINPHTCPNPLNTKSQVVLPVAILGSDELDVYEIDPASVELNGVSSIRSNYKDILTSAESCSCGGVVEPDGYPELILKFEVEALVETLDEINVGDEIELLLTGVLYDGTEIEGSDCIFIRGKTGITEE